MTLRIAGLLIWCAAGAIGQEANPDIYYQLSPDSVVQAGVPKGEIKGPFTLPSEAYPGTQHTYWVYVPAQYDPAVGRSRDTSVTTAAGTSNSVGFTIR